ncbi:MAG TPA: DUF6498-containing protein [Chthoniobacteraceae bacterium]|jgi:hypothetical protein
MRIRALFSALGLNAVPAAGWFFAEWSAGTTLLVYWLETLFTILFISIRILLHRRAVPSKGHWDYQGPKVHRPGPPQFIRRSTFLVGFLPAVLIFTLAHGFFLGVLGFMANVKGLASEAHVDGHGLMIGVLGILVFQGSDFTADLIWLRTRPFRWIELLGQQCFGRIGVVHLTIIGGMCAVAITGANRNFFGVFIALKTMLNLSNALPQYNPETPPAWLCKLMDLVPSTTEDGQATFAEYWRKNNSEEEERIARNNEPFQRTSK